MVKENISVRLDDKSLSLLRLEAEAYGCSVSDIVRDRVRFGLDDLEYNNILDLAKKQGVRPKDVVRQAITFTRILMDPGLSFADMVKPKGELLEALRKNQGENQEEKD